MISLNEKLKNFYPKLISDIENLGMMAMWAIIFLIIIWHVCDLVKQNYIKDPPKDEDIKSLKLCMNCGHDKIYHQDDKGPCYPNPNICHNSCKVFEWRRGNV